MKPVIDDTKFGSITISGVTYDYDVYIRLDGKIEKRAKKLSKAVYGTSHMVSLEEAKAIYVPGARQLIIGTGQTGCVELSEEASGFFGEKRCPVKLFSTGKAIKIWNETNGPVIGMFHVTC